jgi:hypothetical protein
MAWTIPDKGEGDNVIQSSCYQEDLDVLVAGFAAVDVVLSGCAVAPQGSPDMTVSVAKGAVLANGILKGVAAGNATIGTADGTHPRLDLVVADSSGTVAVRAGTAAAAPKPPARSANDVVLAQIYVPASATTITAARVVDKRVMRGNNRTTLYKTTTTETTNTTASAIHILDNANSGIVVPNGLFLPPKMMAIQIGGNCKLGNGSPTLTLAFSFGGTVIFQDVSGAFTADTGDRRAWVLDCLLIAEGDSAQSLTGKFMVSHTSAMTAPNTGIGDLASSAPPPLCSPFSGNIAASADAADNTLSVTLTMSASHADNEIVVRGACVELI